MGLIYLVLVGVVIILHGMFSLFAVFGGLLALRNKRWIWIHLPAVVWAVGIELAGGVCPLTPLENWLRARGGEAGYGGGFVEHYVVPILYPRGLTRDIQVWLGLLALGVNVVVYWFVRRRWRASRPPLQGQSEPSGFR